MVKSTFSKWFGTSGKELEEKMHVDVKKDEIQEISVEKIIPNRFQPRTYFDNSKIEELAQTIKTHGIIQPIVVRTIENDRYEIIAGERRFRAVSSLKWDTIPVIVKDFNDKETASVALIENIQREELSPIEEAYAYNRLLELHELTQEALAQRLGKGQSTIANKLRLLKLPEEIQQSLLLKDITERHARALIVLKDSNLQIAMLKEIIDENLNVQQTEIRVQRLLEPKEKVNKPKFKAFSKDFRLAMNTIRESVTMVTKNGMNIVSEEEENEEFYQFTIKIPKR